MGAQVLDIAQRFRADAVIAHLFGGAPAVSIKEFKRVAIRAQGRVAGVGSAEANIDAAGGFAVAEGYYTMQFAVSDRLPGADEIREMYRKQGSPRPRDGIDRLLQPRVLVAASTSRPSARAQGQPDGKITGADVKAGFEKISNFTSAGSCRRSRSRRPTTRAAAVRSGRSRGQVREGHRLVTRPTRRGGQAFEEAAAKQ